ncbi:DUF4920 domain-containing protein [Geoalkalibacter halelectricus]|uniref:DUF4920 domain-containing protein n=1 Tax=Geoalkalibacter halelectricus TaxID=2847045 RepID=A0ABY5ZKZ7_9BACT|nr:DUF4920 domain-containing protein [Geoalkalibacter halelectricus]MDO3378900.1 DUF4920 domain-containing protein [Geoalkalibacter halelectricus]UWZ79798.1 DUF4920 domain-containing protein [Geoalkalibacter halelectricus]
MKTLSVHTLLVLLCISLWAAPVSAQSFGQGLSLTETTPVSVLLDDPDAYVGQTVQIKGLVVEVCALRGCWMNIAGERPFESVHVKVDDYDMVFPLTARGKTAVVEGVWQKIVRENQFGFARTPLDPNKIPDPADRSTTDTFYQLRGLGAVVEGL